LTSPFTIVLTYYDAFTYSGPTTSAVSLCGLDNQANNYVAFTVMPQIGATATSTSFDITFYGSTVLNYISFFYLMINSTATSNFYTINVPAFCDTTTPTNGIVSGGPATPVQSIPDIWPKPASLSVSAIYVYLLQSFKVQCIGSTDCFVKIIDLTVAASTDFTYAFETDGANTLYEVNFNIFIYDPYPAGSGYYAFGFYTNTFDLAIDAAYTDTAGIGYEAGFQGRCLMGINNLQFSTTGFTLKFDMSKPYSTIKNTSNFIATSSQQLIIFCFL
jgi:hypothetical protein